MGSGYYLLGVVFFALIGLLFFVTFGGKISKMVMVRGLFMLVFATMSTTVIYFFRNGGAG